MNTLTRKITIRPLDLLILALVFLMLVGLIIALIFRDPLLSKRRIAPSLDSLPIYPNAQQVKRENATMVVRETGGTPEEVVTAPFVSFITTDSHETVLAFYSSRLPDDGWQLDGDPDLSNERTLRFTWYDLSPGLGRRNLERFHWLVVTTEQTSEGVTRVELRLDSPL